MPGQTFTNGNGVNGTPTTLLKEMLSGDITVYAVNDAHTLDSANAASVTITTNDPGAEKIWPASVTLVGGQGTTHLIPATTTATGWTVTAAATGLTNGTSPATPVSDPAYGQTALFAGIGTNPGSFGDGQAIPNAQFYPYLNYFGTYHYGTLDIASNGDKYLADTGNHKIRKIDGSSGIVSTLAGSGTGGRSAAIGGVAPQLFEVQLHRFIRA